MLACVWLFVTPWTIVCQAPLSVESFRQEYHWQGSRSLLQEVFLAQGSNWASALQAYSLLFEPPGWFENCRSALFCNCNARVWWPCEAFRFELLPPALISTLMENFLENTQGIYPSDLVEPDCALEFKAMYLDFFFGHWLSLQVFHLLPQPLPLGSGSTLCTWDDWVSCGHWWWKPWTWLTVLYVRVTGTLLYHKCCLHRSRSAKRRGTVLSFSCWYCLGWK